MSAIRAVVWGMLELDQLPLRTILELEKEIIEEAAAAGVKIRRTHRYHDSPKISHEIHGRPTPMKGGRHRKWLGAGGLDFCCRKALEIIEPNNYPGW